MAFQELPGHFSKMVTMVITTCKTHFQFPLKMSFQQLSQALQSWKFQQMDKLG